MGDGLLTAAEVGVKISKWMYHVRRFDVADAEMWRAEINEDMKHMEFDQDLKLYSQLAEYRHNLMLSHVKPHYKEDNYINIDDLTQKIDDENAEVAGFLKYYASLFKGMNEFRNGNFVNAITFYKQGEKYVTDIDCEAEKAEYFFKLAEVYYNMKQTYFSMHYAMLAKDTYSAYDNYEKEKIRCQFVIAGNLIDSERHDEALCVFQDALEKAEDIGDRYFLGLANYNVGMCLHQMGELDESLPYLNESIKMYEIDGAHNLKRALFTLAHVLYKRDNYVEAGIVYSRGYSLCQEDADMVTLSKYKFLLHLYVEKQNSCKIEGDLGVLEAQEHLADVEELSIDAAHFYSKIGKLSESNRMYKKSIEVRRKIQRGGLLYEDYNGSGNVNFFSRT
ncbi:MULTISPECIES: tetratricopeptide repeat protein [Bacillus amyloliquefaciens group]|uniref:response regulator aspartate phosphatase n=1 Tax=Bacillus amyloliquefaciens group TaxID=1938374 RepID=UPI00073BEB5F|nr:MULTISPECIES: tetratricopeptide repeat protein [Bacillus amyloliquefaciens group]KTF59869.1 hypothetical protein AR691_14155 [Bacillus amyloliquefaciens]